MAKRPSRHGFNCPLILSNCDGAHTPTNWLCDVTVITRGD
jgi:hypothetical protein